MADGLNWTLTDQYDAVVMLTQSDWHTEPVSNRYHYATRFSKTLPVVFVQPDVYGSGTRFEDSGYPGVTLLHVPHEYSDAQSDAIVAALYSKGIVRPLVWVFNPRFHRFVCGYAAPLKVYHATEDYANFKGVEDLQAGLRAILPVVDLVVAASAQVRVNLGRLGEMKQTVLLENGCDYAFWGLAEDELAWLAGTVPSKTIIYQGNVNRRMDFALLDEAAGLLPEFEFLFCGRVTGNKEDFKALCGRHGNVRYAGELPLEQVRRRCLDAAVGMVPFVPGDETYAMLPLKCFEYVATGLPVVCADFEALHRHGGLFHIVTTAREFAQAVRDVWESRADEGAVRRRMIAAAAMDYDRRFEELLEVLAGFSAKPRTPPALRVNVLYNADGMHVYTVKSYLGAFLAHSAHTVTCTPATGQAVCPPGALDEYDVVVVLYTVRVNYLNSAHGLSPSYEQALAAYAGHKILFTQDEYENTETLRRAIERLGVRTVFTVVPKAYVERVFPKKRFLNVCFVSILTGYISDEMLHYPKPPIAERSCLIGYRGRELGYWYGRLAREKLEIGIRMYAECQARGLSADIEWEAGKRIYQEDWLSWLAGCKATLGTESGANVFDDSERLRKAAEKHLRKTPGYPFEAYEKRYLRGKEGVVLMNQVSPKMVEAVCLKTALIMYEGTYSGIFKPHEHYIPLKKDFSNIDSVLLQAQDDVAMQQLVDRAYEQIALDKRNHYRWLIGRFDEYAYAGCFSGKAGRPVKKLKYKLWAFQEYFRRDAVHIFLGLMPEGTRRWKAVRWLFLNTVGRFTRRGNEGGQP